MAETTVEAAVSVLETTKTFSAQEIKLMFNPSRSNKSFINIEGDAMFIVTNAIFEEIKERKIANITFKKGSALPEQKDDDGNIRQTMYSWRPIGVESTRITLLEQEAAEVEVEGRLVQAKVSLRKVTKELADLG